MLRTAGVITSWEHEPRQFDFPIRRGTTSYLPDFRVVYPDGRIEWHEVKGWLDDKSITQLRRMAKHYPDEVILVNGVPAKTAVERAMERRKTRQRAGL